jgi:thioester reductase-like protein
MSVASPREILARLRAQDDETALATLAEYLDINRREWIASDHRDVDYYKAEASRAVGNLDKVIREMRQMPEARARIDELVTEIIRDREEP